jgi:hypothetical protein
MATATQEKTEFDMKKVVKIATENVNGKNPANNFKPDEIESKMSKRIEELMLRPAGITPPEVGAALANHFGKVSLHFTFDRNRPFADEEKKIHHVVGLTGQAMVKALGKIRMSERKEAKAKWDQKRREEVALFRQYFMAYLEKTHGPHKENALGVKVGVGDVIELNRGHYKRIY